MTNIHVLTLRDDDGVLVGVYSTNALARQALIEFIAGSAADPTGSETYLGDTCPEDWMFETTAFELATHVMASQTEYKWSIDECEVDDDL